MHTDAEGFAEATTEQHTSDRTGVRIIGYGRTGPDDPAASTLREGDSEVIADTADASPTRGRSEAYRDVTIVLDGDAGTCPGDSGGPALVRTGDRWLQFGVNSWSPRGSDNCRPDVFADVTSNSIRDWIENHLEGRDPCPSIAMCPPDVGPAVVDPGTPDDDWSSIATCPSRDLPSGVVDPGTSPTGDATTPGQKVGAAVLVFFAAFDELATLR